MQHIVSNVNSKTNELDWNKEKYILEYKINTKDILVTGITVNFLREKFVLCPGFEPQTYSFPYCRLNQLGHCDTHTD